MLLTPETSARETDTASSKLKRHPRAPKALLALLRRNQEPPTEWTERFTAADGKIKTMQAEGGPRSTPRRKTIIDIGGHKLIEVLVEENPLIGDVPQEIILSRSDGEAIKFPFAYTTEDSRLSHSLPYYISIKGPGGEILQSGRGQNADYSLAVELLSKSSQDKVALVNELQKKARISPNISDYQYTPQTLEAVKQALAEL